MDTPPPFANVALTVAYDGTDFRGFAESRDVRTVLGVLRAAIETVIGGPADPVGAGRTDAGVHGWGQVVTVQIPATIDLDRFVRSLNGLCAPDIAVRRAERVAPEFSARFSATARTYRYHVWNEPTPHPLLARTSLHVPQRLDVAAMNEAAAVLVGEHDFSSFCRRPKPAPDAGEPSMVRHLRVAHWATRDSEWDGRLLRFEITASSFCHQMVRSIVGTCVDVGLGRREASSMPDVLAARDRNAAGQVAPPTGLVLWAVDYHGTRWDA